MDSLIETYDPKWVEIYKKIEIQLRSALRGLDYQIEHVGSTSVPGLDAKPIIDIDIIYDGDTVFDKIKSSLENIGYYHNGNQGIEAREVFKRNGLVHHDLLDVVRHHLYVCPSTSDALKRHIIFRNALRKNAKARLAYQHMKYALAKKAKQNQKVYAELKEQNVNAFIDDLIKAELSNIGHL